MKLMSISLYNFRNYCELSTDFNPNINIFIGNNAEGKTNLLESIYALAITKSHRTYSDKLLISDKKNFAKVIGKINIKNQTKTLELVINNKGKRISVNNVIYKKLSDYISNMLIIIFSPIDLDLIKGSPTLRRRFLNIEIGQFDNTYLYYLNKYNGILKMRNEYLKNIKYDNVDFSYIDVLDNQLCDFASIIYKYRFNFINNINNKVEKIFKDISFGNLNIKYINNINISQYNDEIRDIMLKKTKDNLKRDVLYGVTMIGPHRDDIEFILNGYNSKDYASQGQQRLVVLSLKLAEMQLFKELKNEYPIVLLDDVFSELDISKRNSIIKYLKDDIQVFITSTDINDIDKEIVKHASIYNIKNGNIV